MYLDTCTGMGGGQHSLLTLLKRLDRSRYLPVLCSPRGSGLEARCKQLGMETRALPFRSVHMVSHSKAKPFAWTEDVVRSAFGVFYLAWNMARLKVDAVHANTFKAALVGTFACLLARKPLIFHDRITIRHGLLEKMVARMDCFDRILPAHGTYPLANTFLKEVLAAFLSIDSGSEPHAIDRTWGSVCHRYRFGTFDVLVKPPGSMGVNLLNGVES